jgi:hypothetical protein
MIQDDDGILKDGESIRVPMFAMDSAQRLIADRTSMAGHRPGSLPLSDAERSTRAERLQARDAGISQRWRSPSSERSNTTDARLRRDQWLTNAWRRP